MTSPHREHSIVTPVHGRYLLRVPETPAHGPIRNAPLAVGFHGYGESADTHLARLEAIAELAQWTLLSIQGLHAFYGRNREVVASWMTSQLREEAIDDNLRYVRSVVTEAIHQNGEPQALVYIGYSQGVAMAWRAAVLGARRVDGLAVFGGDVPPELGVRPLTQCPPVLSGVAARTRTTQRRSSRRIWTCSRAGSWPSSRTKCRVATCGPRRSGARSAASSRGWSIRQPQRTCRLLVPERLHGIQPRRAARR